jgi:hypothetical protein
VRSHCELQVRGSPHRAVRSPRLGQHGQRFLMKAGRGMFGVGPVRRVDAATAFAETWREVRRAQIFAAEVDGSMLDLGNQPIGVA